jgi:aspartyl-tRNA(Asn)/glutamyl-tRNA(Gln) amidotransferase subunit B
MTFETVIGLECHVQLGTRTKAFTRASAEFGAEPNSHTDPYTLALPGTLPVVSRATIEKAITIGVATGCRIRPLSRFARKHYFYPDLPKGYQISQYDEPLCEGGQVELLLEGQVRSVRLTRIHVEEDAGKNVHVPGSPWSLCDYNRAGVPLVEIVSEPDLRSAAEAGAYLRAIRQMVRWLGISDGNMEEGSLRCDANVSLRPVGEQKLGTKTELKNINSFKNVEAAITYEIARQTEVLERGGRVVQETRLWNPDQGTSHAMRSKESAHDYRYFPEPDLPPLRVSDAWVQELTAQLPELPMAARARLMQSLPEYDASIITAERERLQLFETQVKRGVVAKKAANWIITEVLAREEGVARTRPDHLAELLLMMQTGTIGGPVAKSVYEKMYQSGEDPRAIVEREGLTQISDTSAIEAACQEAIEKNPKQADGYRGGNQKMLGFFVGQVMKATQGKANPEVVNAVLKKLLGGTP